MKKVTIEYCGQWGYFNAALRLSEVLKREFGYSVDLIKGSGGVFEVTLEGSLIFSKKTEGRFPEGDEVQGFIRGLEEVS